jgi:DNA-binding beta-propeller fold protein YncE
MTSHRTILLTALTAMLVVTAARAQVAGLTGTLVVTNKSVSTATIIDVGSGRILATLPTGQGPHELVLSSDGGTAVVTDYSGDPGRTLTVIDVAARRVVRTIDLGDHRRPHGIVFLPGDSLVAVTSEASGSSSRSIAGLESSARPSATRWRSPPESWCVRRISSSRSSSRLTMRSNSLPSRALSAKRKFPSTE